MTTNSNITKRAGVAGNATARRQSAAKRGEGRARVVCPSPSTYPGGIGRGHAFRLEGVLRRDRLQFQS